MLKRKMVTLLLSLLVFTSGVKASQSVNLNSGVTTRLSQAIQFQTISHQNRADINYEVFQEFREFLKASYPLVFERLTVKELGKHSLLLTLDGSDKSLKPVLLDSHYDVVPIELGTEKDWTHPPFDGVVADGYVWGRGALDDKASVITTLEALQALLSEGFEPARTLLFSFAHDEEIGGREGAANIAHYIKQQNIELEYAVLEGGLILQENTFLPGQDIALIALAEKTYVTLTLSAKGDGGHSSVPVEDNAIIRLASAVKALHDTPFEPELVSPVKEMLETIGQESGGLKGFVMENQWLSEPLLLWMLTQEPTSNAMVRSTTAVTMFDAGVKENVISQQAEAKVNFRLLPGFTAEQLVHEVKHIINDEQISISSDRWKTSPPVADLEGVGFKRIKSAVNEVQPSTVVTPSLLMATTDSPHYVGVTPNIYRFHSFSMPMSDSKTIHNTNERVSVAGLEQAVKISTALIVEAAKP